MITPSNRTDMVWEVIYNNTQNIEKVVIDNLPFRADPWRIWFLFGAINRAYFNYTYSYIAETHYKMYVEGKLKENPFSLENIIEQGKGNIVSNYKAYFRDVRVSEIKLPQKTHEEYNKLKEQYFDEEDTINKIIRKLSQFAQSRCPKQVIPLKHTIFNKPILKIIKTDLKVDDYLVWEIEERVNLTNNILEAFYVSGIQEL